MASASLNADLLLAAGAILRDQSLLSLREKLNELVNQSRLQLKQLSTPASVIVTSQPASSFRPAPTERTEDIGGATSADGLPALRHPAQPFHDVFDDAARSVAAIGHMKFYETDNDWGTDWAYGYETDSTQQVALQGSRLGPVIGAENAYRLLQNLEVWIGGGRVGRVDGIRVVGDNQ